MIKEKQITTLSGYTSILLFLFLQVGLAGIIIMVKAQLLISIIAVIASLIVFACWFGLFMVQPNQGKVLQLFGQYKYTEKTTGLRWANPLYSKLPVSLRIRNFESGRLKVNDMDGNPIEIAAVVVWKVVDTAQAVFQVDDYENFVKIQTEAAIRNLATSHPYDNHNHTKSLCLRGNAKEVAEFAKQEIQERLTEAGVEVIEARISHLAYAQEIAQAMLRRQQASAIVAARHKIVEGAVGMVELALDRLASQHVVELDEERKAAMVSNLMVVLCGDQNTQPVVNTGTLYS